MTDSAASSAAKVRQFVASLLPMLPVLLAFRDRSSFLHRETKTWSVRFLRLARLCFLPCSVSAVADAQDLTFLANRYAYISPIVLYDTSKIPPVQTAKKPSSVFDLNPYIDKEIRVKFVGGREVVGALRGWDTSGSLILDETTEYLRDPLDPTIITDKTRKLGRVLCKGASVMSLCPVEGMQEIENPFVQPPGSEVSRI